MVEALQGFRTGKRDMPAWVVKNALARGGRPGYSGERGRSVRQDEVDAWVSETRAFGIKSIICLLGPDQLQLYDQLPVDLVSYYRQAGFEVEHVPVRDRQHPALSSKDLADVWTAYGKLTKPVMVHCSAGIDRTGMAVEHIQRELRRKA